MNDLWFNISLELGILVLLGIAYYFYQKKKILSYEAEKIPLVMGYVLQCFLTERGDTPSKDLDPIIEALDDFLKNQVSNPPMALLQNFLNQKKGSEDLRDVIRSAFEEIKN
jgi:hypothetical protein